MREYINYYKNYFFTIKKQVYIKYTPITDVITLFIITTAIDIIILIYISINGYCFDLYNIINTINMKNIVCNISIVR